MSLGRRDVLMMGWAGVACALLPPSAQGEEVESHGLSIFGDLKYSKDFRHFEYVNPTAPKGGVFSQQISTTSFNRTFDTFDSLHIHILKGNGAAGLELCYATLMARALDEPDAMYGLAAKSVRASADRLTYWFTLREGLTFHDASPLTAEDVAWSLNILKSKGHPSISQALQSMTEAVAEAPDLVRVSLTKERGRDMPLVIAALPIFSKVWWKDRDFEQSTLDAPLGSGAYKVKNMDVGRSIELARVENWWGTALPVTIGTNNFETLRWDYYRDRDVAFEAFKARQFLFREEFTSKFWVTGYEFPAAKDGRVKRDVVSDLTLSGAQAWHFNSRLLKFKDPLVRQAIGLAFDFEWTNKNLMFGSYDRTASFFQNSDFMAIGRPSERELALLEPFRKKLPESAFGDAVMPSTSDGSGEDRTALRKAVDLLRQAGWALRDGALKNSQNEALTIEFLDDDSFLERHTAPFIKNLKRLGIEANFRVVDPAQYEARLNQFDFEIISRRVVFGSTPGESTRDLWSSKAAATPGSGNFAGIADPAVDSLIDKIVNAETRQALIDACRALDRVLRAGYYWVPQWNKSSHWLAYWDVFDRPTEKPRYARGIPETWWAKS